LRNARAISAATYVFPTPVAVPVMNNPRDIRYQQRGRIVHHGGTESTETILQMKKCKRQIGKLVIDNFETCNPFSFLPP
jgi:hypothetical protein